MFSRKNFFLFFLVFLSVFTRFFKLDWGDGFYFHPDENNMAFAISKMSFSDLNPHFFAYGQFPLFLAFFSLKIFFVPVNFFNAVLSLRIWSSIFSCLSLLFFYLIGKEFFKKNFYVLIFVLLLIFCPGLIQLAHFGTTESLLILVFSINLFLSLKIYRQLKIKYIFYAGLISGIGLATKITAVFFIIPIFLSLFFLSKKNFFLAFLSTIYDLISTIFFSFIFSPFNLLAFNEFKNSMAYETSVAAGSLKVFYINQFLGTVPFLFQFQKIFPYVLGLPVFIFGLIGIFAFILNTKYHILNTNKLRQFLLIIIPTLVYFLYNGQLYVKWTRFMSPVFFVFPFFLTYFLTKINNKKLIFFIVFISLIPGIVFLNLYFHQDIRLIASNWIEKNIKENSRILSESNNVLSLPISQKKFYVTDFNFFDLENNQFLKENLAYQIFNSDYIIIPSRRVFKNQANKNFPVNQKYYQNLFNGNLGFVKIKEFSVRTDFVLNPENAEETWTVFDQPTVRIFKKNKNLSLEEIKKILI